MEVRPRVRHRGDDQEAHAAAGQGHADPTLRTAAHAQVRYHARVREAGLHQRHVPPVVNRT